MHVIKFVSSNYKALRAVEIEPDGNLVVISGKNGAGKSSVLDAIWATLKNAAASKETPNPIRHGEQDAYSEVHLGDLVVTRTWSHGKASKLTVKANGKKQSSPQALIDSLVGQLSFDPGAFSQLKPAEQRATLIDLVDLPFDPREIEERRQKVYDQRTEVNRDVKRLEGQLAGMPEPAEDLPEKEVSVAELAQEHDLAKRKHVRAENLNAELVHARSNLEDATIELTRWKATVFDCKRALVLAEDLVENIPTDLPGPDEILERIQGAEQANTAVRAGKERRRVAEELKLREASSAVLTTSLVRIDSEKSKGLKAAKFPVEGLSFSVSGVLYQGVPFVQCCASERLKVSAAIAMALNPAIRVIRITDGSLLDGESMAILEELAIEHDAQVWLEVVDESGDVGVYIEDGSVAAVNEYQGATSG